MSHYTQAAFDNIQELFDEDMEKIWEDIETTPEMTEADKWIRKLELIAHEYTTTSRFALMRLCLKWATTDSDDNNSVNSGFRAVVNGEIFQFSEVTIQNALNLDAAEINKYIDLLLNRASTQEDYNRNKAKALIKRAMAINTTLSREEAFSLGHTLMFSLAEMQFFLRRTLEEESGLRFNTSNDLIEAYGFVTNASPEHVRIIKTNYQAKTIDIKKQSVEAKEQGHTLNAKRSLPELVRSWSPDNRDEAFLEWMVSQAPFLDLPSQSALTIYRNLATYAYNLVNGFEPTPTSASFVASIRSLVQAHTEREETRMLLYKDGKVSYEACVHIAEELTIANQNYELDKQPDLRLRFRTIKMKKGQISAYGGIDAGHRSIEAIKQGAVFTDPKHIERIIYSIEKKNEKIRQVNSERNSNKVAKDQKAEKDKKSSVDISRERIENLLFGDLNVVNERAVDKPDLMYLLWLIAMLCWIDDPNTERMNPKTARKWLFNFISAAQLCLSNAMLPQFYPPHLLEQSMMLSLLYAGKTKQDPALVYDHLCYSTIRRRKSKKKQQEE